MSGLFLEHSPFTRDYTFRKKTWSFLFHQLTITKNSTARGRTSHSLPIFLLGSGLTWVAQFLYMLSQLMWVHIQELKLEFLTLLLSSLLCPEDTVSLYSSIASGSCTLWLHCTLFTLIILWLYYTKNPFLVSLHWYFAL